MFQLSKSSRLGGDKASFKGNQIQSRNDNTVSNRVDTNNVSNTHGKLSDGCSSATRNSDSKQEWVDSNSQDYKDKVWSEVERCDQQTKSRGNVSNTNSESWDEFSNDNRISKMPQEEIFRNRSSIQKSTRFRSWWEIECKLRGVPNGVSYELHSDRANRIKALGNSIVPQIAQLIGESILIAEEDDTKQTL